MKPPSTARTAGRSDWAKRRFRHQPFILLSFSSSKKLRKSQETQSYQRFQHIVHTVFNTSGTNAPRSLSHLKVGTHSARRRIAHKGSHAETGAFQTVVVSLPRTVPHVSETLRGQGVERQTLPLWGLGRGYSRRTQRACGTAMRSCALLSRGVAAPLGCVIFFCSCQNCGLYTLGSPRKIAHKGTHAEIGGVSDGGGITTLGPFRTFTNIPGPGVRTANFAAFGSWLGVLPKNAESLRDSDALMRIAVPRRRGPAGLRDLFRFYRNCGLYALCSELSACARRGALSLPSARFACSRNAGRPLVKTTCLPFSEVDGHCSPRNAYFLANIQVFLSAISVANTFALWYDKSQIRIFRR